MNDMFITFFGAGLWAVIKAVLILLLAFLVAGIVKSLVVKLLAKTKLSGLSGKTDASPGEGKRVLEHIGRLVHLVVFLLFVPGIFGSLGMDEISMPILNLLDTMWGYLPNMLAAVVVLWVGLFIARLVREILTPVFARIKVNRLQEMAGIEAEGTAKLSYTLAYIVYVLILIPVIISALQALDMKAISEPAIQMLNIIFGFIPYILVALVITVVGCMVAKMSGNIVESLIAASGLDSKLMKLFSDEKKNFMLSKVVGRTVHAVMVVFFVVESFGVLRLQVLNDIGRNVISYMPYVLAAVLILMLCYIGSMAAESALQKNGHTGYALLCKCAIYTVGGFMVLNELGIAEEIVNSAFLLIIAAIATAFAISFGIGGKEAAARLLKKLEDRCSENRH